MSPTDRDQRLDAAIAAYYREVEAGRTPDRDAFFNEHAELRMELESFLADKAAFERQVVVDPNATLPPGVLVRNVAGSPHPVVRYFGDYELVEEIARGGMGVIYRARQVSLNRTVAVKMILTGQLASPADVQRFRTEAEAAANLDHPNILPVYEVGEFDGQQYFSMNLVDGGSLADRIKEFVGRPRDAVEILAKVARAVHYAHLRGVLHRDLKPANILLGLASGGREAPGSGADKPGALGPPLADVVSYVTDFGLAKRVEGDSGLTQTGAILGTPSYMAPEQARAEKQLTTAADVYALGAILYECLTGRPPFVGTTPLDTVLQVLEKEPARPINCDRDLATVAMKCLEKEPGKRYESAAALADDLDRWSRREPIAARPTTSGERAWRWCRRNPALAGLTAALAVALVAGTIVSALFASAASRRADDFAAARDRADGLAIQANDEANKAKAARTGAERSLYFNHIALAQQYWQAENADLASRILDECPPELRGWEWRYLYAVSHASLLSIPAADRPANKAFGRRDVANVTFSQNGRRMASLAHVWNLNLDRPAAEPVKLDADISATTASALSPDGTMLASADQGHNVALWNTESGKKIRGLGRVPFRVGSLSYSPDGKLLAVGGVAPNLGTITDVTGRRSMETGRRSEEAFCILNVTTGQQVFSPSEGGDSSEFCLDGRYLLGVKRPPNLFQRANLVLWDTTNWAEQAPPWADNSPTRKGEDPIRSFVLSGDGQRIAIRGGTYLRVIEIGSGKPLFSVETDDGDQGRVALSPDGGLLAAVPVNVAVHQLPSGLTTKTFSGPTTNVDIWDVAAGRITRIIHDGGLSVRNVAFSPDGHLITTNENGSIRLWDVRHDPELRRVAPGIAGYAQVCRVSPEGSVVAVAEGLSFDRDGPTTRKIILREARTGTVLHTLSGHVGVPTCLGFSANGHRLATGGNDRIVRIWDVASGSGLCELRGRQSFQLVALSGDGTKAASVELPPEYEGMANFRRPKSGGNTARTWDATTGQEITSVQHPNPISAIIFSNDGRILVTAGGSMVKFWDATAGREIRAFDWDIDPNYVTLQFSPDGASLLATDAQGVSLLDIATGKPGQLIRESDAGARIATFHPNGRRIVTASSFHRVTDIKLWEVSSAQEICTLASPQSKASVRMASNIRGNSVVANVTGLAFTADGNQLVGALSDGAIVAWDAPRLK